MTKENAIKALMEGNKITHRWFSPDEWVSMEGNEIVLEDGVRCDEYEFWRWRTDPSWDIGWEIYAD
jgi:hypothetical protein